VLSTENQDSAQAWIALFPSKHFRNLSWPQSNYYVQRICRQKLMLIDQSSNYCDGDGILI
jgi:hypothetical protein